LKKSRLYLGLELQNRGVVFGIIAAIISTHPVSAQVLMSGGSNARADKVALPDTHNTLSTFSAPRQARPQPLSVILSDATIGLSQSLPDFPRLVTPAATISRRSFTERSHNRCFLKDRGKSNIPSN
jgi:hypothetical protein